MPADVPTPRGGLTLSSYNTWAMPFASSNTLSRPARCAAVAADALLGTGVSFGGGPDGQAAAGGLVVQCFQEAWAYKCGLAWPFLTAASLLERHLPRCFAARRIAAFSGSAGDALGMNGCASFVAHAIGALTVELLPFPFVRWDGTKRALVRRLRRRGLSHVVGLSGTSMSWRPTKLMDSGLLLVASRRPIASGFEAYAATGGVASEGCVNKGFLWALFADADGGEGTTLVVTSHLHATDDACRAAQCRQLVASTEWLHALLPRAHAPRRSAGEEGPPPRLIVICGDLNEPAGRVVDEALRGSALGFGRLTDAGAGGTCRDARGELEELDHVYAALVDERGSRLPAHTRALPVWSPSSDHACIRVHGIAARPQDGHA